jgi:hypothetical protein
VVYHAINRGNHREVVVADEDDHRAFLPPLPEWADRGANEPARRAAWGRTVRSDQPAAEVEARRRSLRGGRPSGGPPRVATMAVTLGRRLERRPPGGREGRN